ncbi:hypothetical protein CYMTET_22758 [Cymbomonas tetramitiformis]|uniref:Uncharacterized protein n=1 Tax=Cymbomonas tetramitiformis TaxID=36881 RepID=A0AAE0L1L2_9CHLO|nr:hypothetical protein CYMTET_46431 [Cymbomonas tetramitiformis]KAK3268756.1 hypothetical protein CYMTET_22758 [Cymbomonas tetramitiformis]
MDLSALREAAVKNACQTEGQRSPQPFQGYKGCFAGGKVLGDKVVHQALEVPRSIYDQHYDDSMMQNFPTEGQMTHFYDYLRDKLWYKDDGKQEEESQEETIPEVKKESRSDKGFNRNKSLRVGSLAPPPLEIFAKPIIISPAEENSSPSPSPKAKRKTKNEKRRLSRGE